MENDKQRLIEHIKYRSDIRKHLIHIVNNHDCDMSEYKTFSTHTECYTEKQMFAMIADRLLFLEAQVLTLEVKLAAARDYQRRFWIG